ncbi:hypothetical protein EPA93_22345 [Ktedonosporobacter rubrisoli]|uniref:Uncharacterized protein n=1 Tax=Ktedonosporobacter rubrisoli TaxID=2509675 RepID=A0A4P6JT33_KTERU|nr:hypothetical protein [Ktedonosporobacter rubrisoli]QBD78584.1 hypothetical protein EPA93_22345 [Ktedonosporobacter rubrisoli]
MQQRQVWPYLIPMFAVFFVLFTTILIIGNFPVLVIIFALTSILGLSTFVVALAWAWNHNY